MAYTNPALQNSNGASPSHFQSGTGEVILVGNDLLKDKPQYLTELYQTYNEKTPWLYKLKALGFSRMVGGPETGHYEEPRRTRVFTFGTIITSPGGPTPGKTMVVEVSPADMISYSNIYNQTIVGSLPRKDEVFMTSNKQQFRIMSKDESVNPHRLTIKPWRTDGDTVPSVIEGQKAVLLFIAKGEATGQPAPLTERYYKYVNTFGILKETKVMSGTYQTTQSPFAPVKGKPGYFYVKGIEQTGIDHEKQKSQFCLFGEPGNNITEASGLGRDVPVQGTDGLVYFAKTYGMQDAYGDLANYDIDDFYALSSYYEERRVTGTDIVLMQGYDLSNRQDIILKDFIDGTCVDYTAEKYMGDMLGTSGLSPEKMFVTLGFKGVRLGSYNYLKMGVDEFNDSQGVGAFDFKRWQIAVPMGFFKNKSGNNEKLPIMGYEYRGRPGYSRENELVVNGGTGDEKVVKSSDLDLTNWYYKSEIATHFSHGNWFFVSHP